MSGNIVSAVEQFLTPDLIDKLASAAGLERGSAKKAVEAAVPAILSGLVSISANPQGARRLANDISKQPMDSWEGRTSVLGDPVQAAQGGSSILTSLLGVAGNGALMSGISKFVGIGEGSTRTLIGLLGPAVMWVLGQQRRTAGVDAEGVVDMLQSQKDLIAAALPTGLSSLLKSSGFYDRPGIAASPDDDRASQAYSRATAAVNRATTGNASAHGWAYWALPILALAGLGWYFLGADRADQKVATVRGDVVALPPQLEGSVRDGIAYFGSVPANAVSVGTYHGRDVYNRAGEKIGIVTDLVIGPDGKIAAAVISVGRFLGISEKEVAIPFSALQRWKQLNELQLVVDVVRDQLDAAPAFEQLRERLRVAPGQNDPATAATPSAATVKPTGSTMAPQ